MGLFPYECDKCRGGDFRCGSTVCKSTCKGGQFCWEERVVLVLAKDSKKIVFESIYDGYGRIYINLESPSEEWSWEEFGLTLEKDISQGIMYINLNDYNDNIRRNKKIAKVYCKSCYDC